MTPSLHSTVIGTAVVDFYLCNFSSEEIKSTSSARGAFVITQGAKIQADTLHMNIGGGALNVSCALTNLGFATTPIATVGTDMHGAWIAAELTRRTITTDLIRSESGRHTGISLIISQPPHDSTIFTHRGASEFVQLPDNLTATDLLYIAPLAPAAAQHLNAFLCTNRTRATTIAINPSELLVTMHHQLLVDALPYVDMVIMNAHEAHQFVRHIHPQSSDHDYHNPRRCSELLHAQFPHLTIIITDGAHGAYAAHDGLLCHQPSYAARITNTVGAGDAFGATFAAWRTTGQSVETSMTAAQLQSKSVLEGTVSTAGLLTHEQLEAAMRTGSHPPCTAW